MHHTTDSNGSFSSDKIFVPNIFPQKQSFDYKETKMDAPKSIFTVKFDGICDFLQFLTFSRKLCSLDIPTNKRFDRKVFFSSMRAF